MAEYDFERTVTVPAAPGEAWRLVTDVPRLVGWISVLHDAREQEPLRSYTAVISDKIGMFALRADLGIQVVDVEVDTRIVVEADGQDRQVGSRISIRAEVSLESADDGTRIRVRGRYVITGKAATLGSSTIRRKGEKVLDEFCEHLSTEAAAA